MLIIADPFVLVYSLALPMMTKVSHVVDFFPNVSLHTTCSSTVFVFGFPKSQQQVGIWFLQMFGLEMDKFGSPEWPDRTNPGCLDSL